jgi:hypothetical protein
MGEFISVFFWGGCPLANWAFSVQSVGVRTQVDILEKRIPENQPLIEQLFLPNNSGTRRPFQLPRNRVKASLEAVSAATRTFSLLEVVFFPLASTGGDRTLNHDSMNVN